MAQRLIVQVVPLVANRAYSVGTLLTVDRTAHTGPSHQLVVPSALQAYAQRGAFKAWSRTGPATKAGGSNEMTVVVGCEVEGVGGGEG